MWINKKTYKFLKENAAKNINAEAEIFLVEERCKLKNARALEEYSATLEKIDKIKENLEYYLDVNEENGVVYIPKFVIEDIVNDEL